MIFIDITSKTMVYHFFKLKGANIISKMKPSLEMKCFARSQIKTNSAILLFSFFNITWSPFLLSKFEKYEKHILLNCIILLLNSCFQ